MWQTEEQTIPFRQICDMRPPKLEVCSLIMVFNTLDGLVDGKTTGRPLSAAMLPRSLAWFLKSTVFPPPSEAPEACDTAMACVFETTRNGQWIASRDTF